MGSSEGRGLVGFVGVVVVIDADDEGDDGAAGWDAGRRFLMTKRREPRCGWRAGRGWW